MTPCTLVGCTRVSDNERAPEYVRMHVETTKWHNVIWPCKCHSSFFFIFVHQSCWCQSSKPMYIRGLEL